MTLKELQGLLDTHGAAPERWPADRRQAALDLLAQSAEARAMRDGAAAFDRILDREANPARARLSVEAIVEHATAAPQGTARVVSLRRQPAWELRLSWINLAGMAAAAGLGFVIGWTGLIEFSGPAQADGVVELIYGIVRFEDAPW